MADVITVSSSEDENETPSPPRKRIKPTPVLSNLPQISITKITTPKPQVGKKQDIVVLCSDDEEEEEVTYVDAKEVTEIEKNRHNKDTNNDNVFKSCYNERRKNKFNMDIEEIKDDSEIIKDLEDSCEIINEDSCEESSGKENRAVEAAIKDSIQPSSSGPGKSSNTTLLAKFVKIINEQTNEEKYKVVKVKFPFLWKFYHKCEDELGECVSFKNMLLSNIKKAKKSTALAVISFNDVFQHLNESRKADYIEVDKEHLVKLKKLEKTIRSLVIMIKQLEQEEIDFDQDDDSCYIKLDKYMARLDKVYKKYCLMLKKNPYSGRLTYSKLDFVDSNYNEINRAISKKYKNNKKFPSYYEIEKLIEKVVKENNLDISESKIKTESVHCFKQLGELLQIRRRKDLYDSHYMLIKDGEDPANNDSQLSKTLQQSYQDGQSSIDKLVQEYVNKASTKTEESESNPSAEDSDNSNYVDSEDEDKEKEKEK